MTSNSPLQAAPAHCHNCGAAVDYHYCAVCGQETRLHVPSAAEFIHEFIGHYIALEGRLWRTLALLLFKPGFLTWEYIQGRRVRYVQPLRVYLTFSILFFAVLKLAGPIMFQADTEPAARASVSTSSGAPAGPAPAPAVAKPAAKPAAEQDAADVAIGRFPTFAKRLKAFLLRPATEQAAILGVAFYGYVPYAMFCLMPLFAAYLKLLYLGSGRRYGEHLLFALHTNAFAFAVLACVTLLVQAHGPKPAVAAMVAWLAFYLPTAMRRVYGGSRLVTFVRWIVLALFHVLSIVLAVLLAFSWAIMH